MGILDTYNNTQFSSVSRPTGRGRFSKYDYTASFADKEWSVSQNGIIVVSDNNSNTSSVNEQLARDWINNDWKRRKAIEAADNIPLDPGLQDALDDSEDEEEIPDTSTDTDNLEITPMTDDQRFLIIGLAVAAALFGFIKR